ncbi:MAG: TIGR02757 family protein [Nitrospirota bacterium]|nr:TIGR02757 family protein [Nitrospirota bacterium]
MLSVKQVLDKFYGEYDFKARILHDPIEFPHRYKRREDIEIAGFIASCFAYGKVGLFKPVIEKILSAMRGSPYNFLMEFKVKKDGRLFSGIKYRFNENKDIICLLHIIGHLLRSHKSLENVFKSFYKKTDSDTGNALTGFIDYALKTDTADVYPVRKKYIARLVRKNISNESRVGVIPFRDKSLMGFKASPELSNGVYGKNLKPDGLLQFFPSPSKGSACKRMNLFLRWMIRQRDIDFGIWKGIPENKLVIPLDTHIAKISKCLGFTKRKSQDWKMAVEITDALKKLDSDDPLKYDFAMCHYGISGLCGPEFNKCDKCIFKNLT